MSALTDHLLSLRGTHVAVRVEDQQVTYAELLSEASVRAAVIAAEVSVTPRHVGVLLPNGFEAMYWLIGALLTGAPVVGLNSTRRGTELADDVRHTDCAVIVTDGEGKALLDAAGVRTPCWVIGTEEHQDRLSRAAGARSPSVLVPEDRIAILIFTSGTTNAPKAAIRTHGSLAQLASRFVESCSISPHDVAYNAMPWFHSNALYHAVIPTLLSGGTLVLRPRFSASQFIHEARRYGVTRFNYVGKVLEYILATPERADDLDNSIRLASGSEASERDIAQFTRRFGVWVRDGFGSTESGIAILREEGMPRGALGVAADDTTVVMDAETEVECPRAVFDENGVLANGSEAVGEMVNTGGVGSFEGYYANDEANAERTRRGWYWSGDLAYRDQAGYFYFAGRGYDWLRVDGENFAAVPVERVVLQHPDVVLAAVYAVPDPNTGDRLMLTVELTDSATFDPDGFAAFLDAQPDLGQKWRPTFVRVTSEMPVGHTNKIQKTVLRRQAWLTDDAVWWRPGRDHGYRLMDAADVEGLAQAFAAAGRSALAPIPEHDAESATPIA